MGFKDDGNAADDEDELLATKLIVWVASDAFTGSFNGIVLNYSSRQSK